MSWWQKDPLRPLSEAERRSLSCLSRSQSAPAAQVARTRALLTVAAVFTDRIVRHQDGPDFVRKRRLLQCLIKRS